MNAEILLQNCIGILSRIFTGKRSLRFFAHIRFFLSCFISTGSDLRKMHAAVRKPQRAGSENSRTKIGGRNLFYNKKRQHPQNICGCCRKDPRKPMDFRGSFLYIFSVRISQVFFMKVSAFRRKTKKQIFCRSDKTKRKGPQTQWFLPREYVF